MIADDEAAVICDFAEIYHIFDYKALPVRLAATLAAGFGANSRSMKRALGIIDQVPDSILLAAQADYLYNLQASLIGEDEPRKVTWTGILLGQTETKKRSSVVAFDNGEEWERKKKEIIGG